MGWTFTSHFYDADSPLTVYCSWWNPFLIPMIRPKKSHLIGRSAIDFTCALHPLSWRRKEQRRQNPHDILRGYENTALGERRQHKQERRSEKRAQQTSWSSHQKRSNSHLSLAAVKIWPLIILRCDKFVERSSCELCLLLSFLHTRSFTGFTDENGV